MKKLLALFLAMMMVVSLAACGSSTAAPASSAAAAESSAAASEATATKFPTKQITVICPLGAGGASDAISRLYAAALQKESGVSVVVENKPGAGAGVGLEAIASSDPDGYTIGYIPAEVTTVQAMGNATVTPDNYTFLASAMKICAMIAVPKDSKWNSLDDLIKDAKANPGKITIGTAGVGNAYELGLRQFMKSAGIELNVVNFSNGTADAITAMLGGNVQACTCGTSEAMAPVKNGQFKMLCHLSSERSKIFPDVPTATELGYACNGGSWGAFAVPAGTPDDIVKILRDFTKTAINSDDMKSTLAERGFDEYYTSGEEFAATAKELYTTNSATIKEFKLSAN